MHTAVHKAFQSTLHIIVSVNTGTQHMCTRKLHPSSSRVCIVSLLKLWLTEMSLYFKLELQVSLIPSHQHLSTWVSVFFLLFQVVCCCCSTYPSNVCLKSEVYFRLKNEDSTIKTHWKPKKLQHDVHLLQQILKCMIGYTTQTKVLNKEKQLFGGNKGAVLMISERAAFSKSFANSSVFYFCFDFSTSHIW